MKTNLTSSLLALAVVVSVALGCSALKKAAGGDSGSNNSSSTSPSPTSTPATKMPSSKSISWELGNNISLAAILYNLKGSETSDSLSKAKILAEEVGATVPAFPTRKGDKIKDTADILGYLLQDAFKNMGAKVQQKYGSTEAGLFEMSLKSNTLLLIYGPGDSTGKAVAGVIKRNGKNGGLPENLWMPLVNKIESGASFDDVKDAVLTMQKDVGQYLQK